MNKRMHRVGKVHYVYAYNESNWELHEQIQNVPEGCMLFVDAFNCNGRAIFGDLVAKYLILYKKCRGLIINGKMRDTQGLIKENYPIWCTGANPIGCYNKKNDVPPPEAEIEKRRAMFEGGVMVADDTGVVLIRKEQLSEDILNKLEFMELQEDIWFFCMDTYKMSTYEIVCQKKYLSEKGLIEPKQLQQLSEFSDKLDKR